MNKEIKQKEDDNKGMFYIEDENGIIAELTYTRQENGILTIDHTEVDEKYEGKGVGAKLVEHTVDFARKEEIMIDPLCAYAAAQFKRNESYSDVRV